jgi:7-keto-8-aminopelargonate synthetase-like enzyme
VVEHCGVPPEDVDVFMGTYTKVKGVGFSVEV